MICDRIDEGAGRKYGKGTRPFLNQALDLYVNTAARLRADYLYVFEISVPLTCECGGGKGPW
jgi:hypothetical protein